MMPYLKAAMRKIALDIESAPVDEMLEALKVTYPHRNHNSRLGIKELPCSAEGCSKHRNPEENIGNPRGAQMCTVKANHVGPVFCSLNCYFYYKGTLKEKENDKRQGA